MQLTELCIVKITVYEKRNIWIKLKVKMKIQTLYIAFLWLCNWAGLTFLFNLWLVRKVIIVKHTMIISKSPWIKSSKKSEQKSLSKVPRKMTVTRMIAITVTNTAVRMCIIRFIIMMKTVSLFSTSWACLENLNATRMKLIPLRLASKVWHKVRQKC